MVPEALRDVRPHERLFPMGHRAFDFLSLECCDVIVHQRALRVYQLVMTTPTPHLNNSLYWFIKPLKQISLQTTLAVPLSLDFTESGL